MMRRVALLRVGSSLALACAWAAWPPWPTVTRQACDFLLILTRQPLSADTCPLVRPVQVASWACAPWARDPGRVTLVLGRKKHWLIACKFWLSWSPSSANVLPSSLTALPGGSTRELSRGWAWGLVSAHCCPRFRRFQLIQKELKLHTDYSGN